MIRFVMTDDQADQLNRSIVFNHGAEPNADGHRHPYVLIGGVQVFIYADPEHGLVLSVHCEDARPPLLYGAGFENEDNEEHDGHVPLRLMLEAGEAFAVGWSGAERVVVEPGRSVAVQAGR